MVLSTEPRAHDSSSTMPFMSAYTQASNQLVVYQICKEGKLCQPITSLGLEAMHAC